MLDTAQHSLRTVTIAIDLPANAAAGETWRLLVPRPVNHWGIAFEAARFGGIAAVDEIGAINSPQRAYVLTLAQMPASPSVVYEFRDGPAEVPAWAWDSQNNRYTNASDDLAQLAGSHVDRSASQIDQLRALAELSAELFHYGHGGAHFNDGTAQVPAIKDPIQGTCVDINTFLLAAARAIGLRGQYVAGYWFHPEKTATHDMHCWLAFSCDGEIVFWDVAHHLKWGVPELGAGLNPAGGRRVPMSFGRGHIFQIAGQPIEAPHFSEPVWISPAGEAVEPAIVATVTDPQS